MKAESGELLSQERVGEEARNLPHVGRGLG